MAVFLSLNLWAQEARQAEDTIPARERTVSADDAPRSAAEMFSAEMRTASSAPPNFSTGTDNGAPGIVESISARRLAHKPLKSARKEFERALAQLKKQRPGEAEQHLRKAVQLDPEYVEAHAQLGAFYLRTGAVSAALQHLDAAIAIEPNVAALHSNRAWALLTLGHGAEAESSARVVLRFEPSSETGHYLLGAAMVQQGHTSAELMQHLEIAARKYPEAAQALQELRVRRARE